MPADSVSQTQRFREPLSRTLIRTVGLAVVVGAILAWRMGGMQRFTVAFLIVLWFTFGGHWVEVFYLNTVRPLLPATRIAHVAARVILWFFGGALLGLGAVFTARAMDGLSPDLPRWWMIGSGFIVVELIVHLMARTRGIPNFYDGRG